MTIAYPYRDCLYLNLTNRCPTACVFCVKRTWRWDFRGWNLKLGGREPSVPEAWEEVLSWTRRRRFRELVFCGYGDCTYRLSEMLEIAAIARRELPGVRLRLNTIGLGNLIWGRDIAPELAAALDAVSVSLNTADPEQWVRLHRPLKAFRRRGFAAILDFIQRCVQAGLETSVTAIDQPGVDLEALESLARSLGAGFRVRPLLEAGRRPRRPDARKA